MKIFFFLMCLALCIPAAAQNYRAGASNRPNFGSSAALEQQSAAAPGAKSTIQTRTFSNYSSRQNNTNQAARPENAAMTQQAMAPQNFEQQVAQTDKAVDALLGGKPAPGAAAPGGKKAAATASPEAPAAKPAATAGGANAPAAPAADASAQQAMAQVQGLLKGLEGLQQAAGAMGAMGGSAGAGASSGNAAAGSANKQMTDAMNAHSADISAFMNAAGKGK